MNDQENQTITWHLRVAYDGSNFAGWQVQPNGVATIQGEILSCLRRLYKQPELNIVGTSRTDAGVHALDQHISFKVNSPFPIFAETLLKVLNRQLPSAIRILDVQPASNLFSARFNAKAKAYVYCLHRGQLLNPFEGRFFCQVPDNFCINTAKTLLTKFLGKHDFASFGVNPKREIVNTERTIYKAELVEQDNLIFIWFLGDSFLYKMVRSMVGYVIHAATTPTWQEKEIDAVFAARQRSAARDTAPGNALFLAKVFFDNEEWDNYVPLLPPYLFF